VVQLFGYAEPAILTSPDGVVGGPQYYSPALQYLNHWFSYTSKGCPTYQPCWNQKWVQGATATPSGATVPVVPYDGMVAADIENGLGYFNVTRSTATTNRGLWMWRSTGLGANTVHAYDDSGAVYSSGGIALANALGNDWIGGVRASTANVSVAMLSSSIAGVWLDPTDGSVRAASGVAVGTHTVDYRICSLADATRCDDAVVSVVVTAPPPNVIAANNDAGKASMGTGGIAIANVLANDTLGNNTPTAATVTLTQLSTTHPGVNLNVLNGSVVVNAGTANGTHSLVYRLCETAKPSNCAQATATVSAYVIDAINDAARGSSKTGGVVIASVLDNDFFNGARATLAQVKLSLPAALPKGITLNLANGAVSVAPKTSSGLYTFGYQICEILSPAHCDQATVTLDLSGRGGT
jgi:hypothetical protein